MSDRALRKLVAEIASAPPDDIEAILDALGGVQRLRVKALLAEMAGLSEIGAAEDRVVEQWASRAPEGLSPWLAARLAEQPQRGGAPASGMTPATLTALADAAAVVQHRRSTR